MWWDHGNWDGGDWFAMTAMMVLFWGGLIALLLWTMRGSGAGRLEGQAKGAVGPGAQAMLAERFARGEIDAAEFERNRELLRGSDTASSRSAAL